MAAFYAGLDVSDLTTAICVIDANGKTVGEHAVETNPVAIVRALKPYGRVLKIVGQESGAKSAWLHKELSKKRVPVTCIDARAASGPLAAQRNKTDKNDARGLAQLLRAGWYTSSHVKSDEALRIRLLLNYRRALKRHGRSLELTLRMSMKNFGVATERHKEEITLRWNRRTTHPMLMRLTQMMLRARTMIFSEVKALDELTRKLAKDDPVCRRLMTVPGVGPLTALTFKAAVDDPSRFASSRTVAAHFGLTPRRIQSGQTDYSAGISRMGDASVRAALYEAAFAMIVLSKSNCSLRTWGLKLKAEKGLSYACIAVARKLAVVLHRMWITGRDFDPRPI